MVEVLHKCKGCGACSEVMATAEALPEVETEVEPWVPVEPPSQLCHLRYVTILIMENAWQMAAHTCTFVTAVTQPTAYLIAPNWEGLLLFN